MNSVLSEKCNFISEKSKNDRMFFVNLFKIRKLLSVNWLIISGVTFSLFPV